MAATQRVVAELLGENHDDIDEASCGDNFQQ
jgi:hypothetical protein